MCCCKCLDALRLSQKFNWKVLKWTNLLGKRILFLKYKRHFGWMIDASCFVTLCLCNDVSWDVWMNDWCKVLWYYDYAMMFYEMCWMNVWCNVYTTFMGLQNNVTIMLLWALDGLHDSMIFMILVMIVYEFKVLLTWIWTWHEQWKEMKTTCDDPR